MKKLLCSLLFVTLSLSLSCSEEKEGGNTNNGDVVRPVTPSSSKWISQVHEYRPAPGQWINETAYGTLEASRSIIGGKGMVSLGAFGGYIIFSFDHSVINGDGDDFVILGNAYEGSSEPGIVMVSADINRNGLPDDPWYELRGENHGMEGVIPDYSITYYAPSQTDAPEDIRWSDKTGREGTISSQYMKLTHPHCYYPLFIEGSPSELTFSGTLLAPLLVNNGTEENPFWHASAAGKGYADNYSPDYDGAVDGDPDTAKGNKFDISNAVDSAGNKVELVSIDFIKVYTAVNEQGGTLGEISTEVRGAVSLTVRP